MRARLVEGVESRALSRLLGLDRDGDFGAAEREDADALVEIFAGPGDPAAPSERQGLWSGEANVLDARPMYRWPAIDAAAHATVGAGADDFVGSLQSGHRAPFGAELILQRRSAQAFDPKHRMSASAVLRHLRRPAGSPASAVRHLEFHAARPPPALRASRRRPAPGLYVLGRSEQALTLLKEELSGDFAWTTVAGRLAQLPLYLLKEMDARGMARRLFCNQAIGGDSSFGVALLSEFGAQVASNPWRYRQLHWEAGLIGQALYLEAEAHRPARDRHRLLFRRRDPRPVRPEDQGAAKPLSFHRRQALCR